MDRQVKGMNILIVEHDRQEAQRLRKRILKRHHWATMTLSGRAAVKLVSQCSFDLLLLDIFLPDALGHTLIPEFKALSPQTHIVVMTSYHTCQLEREVRDQGIADYLTKPFEMNHLETIMTHLDQRKEGDANGRDR